MDPQPSQQFLLDTCQPGPLHYWLSCTACQRESQDCGSDRNTLAIEARKNAYRLVPGLGWICHHCSWALEQPEVTISGTVETNP
jgi:hypothetical protein